MKTESRLKYFPISFFSIIMGLTGFTIAFQKVESILLGIGNSVSTYFLFGVASLFVLFTVLYALKLMLYFPQVREEAVNPVRLSFFPTFSISLILMSIAFLDVNAAVSKYLWSAGTILHFFATLIILSMWVRQTRFEISHYNPAWFIPIVGNILVPIAGVEHISAEFSWFFYSIGIVFWILLFAIFLYRIIFTQPMPDKLLPTFFILIAPPALGFISYVKLTGTVDGFAKILYYFALFLVIFLLAQIRMFSKIKFYLSWWAYSFPLASISVATALMYMQTGFSFFLPILVVLMLFLFAVIAGLLVQTVKAAVHRELCKKEE